MLASSNATERRLRTTQTSRCTGRMTRSVTRPAVACSGFIKRPFSHWTSLRRTSLIVLEFSVRICECFATDSSSMTQTIFAPTTSLESAPPNTLVVIDYLQLLDQKRANPDLMHQVRQIRTLARERELVVLCLSQIDRSYDPEKRTFPDISDVRLPNPVDLRLFDTTCFLNQGKMQVASSG